MAKAAASYNTLTDVPAPRGTRQHKATYATDKRNGGYLIRVIGPHSNRFADRDVPVERKDNSETVERLTRLIWTGKDDDTGQPVSLYQFKAKPRDNDIDDAIPF